MISSIRRAAAVAAALLFLTASFTAPSGAGAQQGPPGAGQGQRRGNPLFKILENLKPPLTDAQKSQIRTIYSDARKQNENVTDRDQRRANMRKASDQIRTVLNPQQRTEYDAQVKAMRERYKQQQHGGNG